MILVERTANLPPKFTIDRRSKNAQIYAFKLDRSNHFCDRSQKTATNKCCRLPQFVGYDFAFVLSTDAFCLFNDMPHIGHLPASLLVTCGCIEQV